MEDLTCLETPIVVDCCCGWYLTALATSKQQHCRCQQVGCAAGVEEEAVQLVDRLQSRLRRVVGQVAASSSRPKVLSLEGLQPLVLGKYSDSVLSLADVQPLVKNNNTCNS